MLSPSIRQVFHALLTRPPLTYNSLGFVINPFDLHVLGTPPAFILSQDQTLIIKFISSTSINWLISVYFLFKGFCSLNNSTQYFFFKIFISLRIFRVALLFICQGSIKLHLIFMLVLSATALIEYHNCFNLSSTFLIFFCFFVI